MVQSIHYNELNEVMNCKASVKDDIRPGMAATMFVGSDRYAMVVTSVHSPKHISVTWLENADMEKLVKEDNIEMLPESLLEKYTNTLSMGSVREYTLRKNGRWMPKGEGLWGTCSLHIGHADNYRDPSF